MSATAQEPTMNIILAHDHCDPDHLVAVRDEMERLGAPVIKAVWMDCWGAWCALEGCHRLRAALDMGLMPKIEEVPYDDTTTVLDLGLDFQDEFRVCAIVEGGYARQMLVFP